MRELALFAGAGGGILGGVLLGWRTVCAVEINDYCRDALLQRQRAESLPRFPIWDDVCTFDGKPWRGKVDVISGGFPCQDISSAGSRKGITGPKSGLWREYARIIGEVRPRFVFIENSPHLRTNGLSRVLQDLTALRYDSRWCVLGADDCGAPHRRKRKWIAAADADYAHDGHSAFDAEMARPSEADAADSSSLRVRRTGDDRREGAGQETLVSGNDGASRATGAGSNASCPRLERRKQPKTARQAFGQFAAGDWWKSELGLARLADGMADRVERTRASGNGQVPTVAALAWTLLTRGEVRGHASNKQDVVDAELKALGYG